MDKVEEGKKWGCFDDSRSLVCEISLENLSLTPRWTLERLLRAFSSVGWLNGETKSLLDDKKITLSHSKRCCCQPVCHQL